LAQVVLVTGASSGFGRLMANALAAAGHTVYASMRGLTAKNATLLGEIAIYAKERQVDLRTIELDVQSDTSATSAVEQIIAQHGRIDVLIHNAGHMVWGPSEAFTPEQLAELYDINVVGTQRVNRAALPHMRAARQGLVIWTGSSSAAGGVPPLLGPYFAAKAGMDALAESHLKNASLHVPSAGHWPQIDEPEQVAKAMLS
jgi:NAD(P)-dependent dehydrogenase (short-subunit alcohol dehydrogenase family)